MNDGARAPGSRGGDSCRLPCYGRDLYGGKMPSIPARPLLAALLLSCALVVRGAPPPEPVEDDGLVKAEPALLDELYVAPGVSLANYHRVMLDPIEVGFKKGWRRDHPDMSNKDFDDFCDDLARLLHETLVKELAAGGYLLAEAPANDVLHLHASIVDAEFAAPEVGVDKSTAVYVDGRMTFVVKGFDAQSGVLVARARDKAQDPETRRADRADRVSALVNAKLIFTDWARELRSVLDVAKVHAGARTPQH
jgi:hypothetical protein